MARLKFDRKINMKLGNEETVRIPENEVWKVEYSRRHEGNPGGIHNINGIKLSLPGSDFAICKSVLGGGAR